MNEAKFPYGKIVLEQRKRLKLTQGKLGEMLGRSKVWVCDLEKGKIGLRADIILPLANALEVSPDIFLSAK